MSAMSGKAGFLATALTTAVLSVVNAPLSAENFERGQALYENHCKECHEGQAHTRHGSKINSVEDIRSWVESWSVHSGLNWSREEVHDVSNYLNNRFYRLSEKP